MAAKNRLEHIVHSLIEYRKLWLAPAILGAVLATGYAFFLKSETWTARQTMIIRDDLLGDNFKPGSFLSQEAMKSAQETVLETARRPEVIRATLKEIGPSRRSLFGLGGVPSSWPSDETVESVRGSVSFESANGGEIGKSEVIVLAAKANNADRANQFISVLTEEMGRALARVRADRFSSMEQELLATSENARRSKELLEGRLADMERELGRDISLVRGINDKGSGGPTAFDNRINTIQTEQREMSRQLTALKSIRSSLETALRSRDINIPTSAELLTNQPALAALVTSLAKARSDLAEAEGQYTPAHMLVLDGRETVESMKRQIKLAVPQAIRGIENQIALRESRIQELEDKLIQHGERLQSVSGKRVRYKALDDELDKRTTDYSEANARLAQVQARKDASDSIQLLTRIGEPVVGTRPDGMSKKAIMLAGAFGGLMIGFGLVMIVAPPFDDPDVSSSTVSHWSEALADRLDALAGRQSSNTASHERTPSTPPPAHSPPQTPAHESSASTASATATSQAGGPLQLEPRTANASSQGQASAGVSQSEVAPTPPARPQVDSQGLSAADITAQLRAAGKSSTRTTNPEEVAQAVSGGTPPGKPQSATPTPTVPVTNVPVSHPAMTPSESAKPVSKTLAAIFANMPQPRTDATVMPPAAPQPQPATQAEHTPGEQDDSSEVFTTQQISDRIKAMSEELKHASQTADTPTPRQGPETVQLPDDQVAGATDALPLQRRNVSTRPVDIAKSSESTSAENESGPTARELIDSAFSELQRRSGSDSDEN